MSDSPKSQKLLWAVLVFCCVTSTAAVVAVGFLFLRQGSPVPGVPNANAADVTETLRVVADRDVSLGKRSGRGQRSKELEVGFRTVPNGDEYHTALHFLWPEEWRGRSVRKAVLKVYYIDAWDTFDDRLITAHEILEEWNEVSLRYSIGRSTAFATNTVGGREPGWFYWDATPAARYWAAHPAENYGVMLMPGTGVRENSLRFASSRSTNSAFHPVLEITFSDPVRR